MRQRAAGQSLQSRLHFPGGFIGKGDRHNTPRTDATDLDEVGYPMGDDPRLTATRTRQYEHRPTDSFHSLSLRGVKLIKGVHHSNYNIYHRTDTKQLHPLQQLI
ncbi:hypothetical protein ES703_102357 [subsurface metagenome]